MEVYIEGKHNAQGEGFQALSGVCIEHRTSTEAHIWNRHHLRNEGENQLLTAGTMSTVILSVSSPVCGLYGGDTFQPTKN